MNRTEKRDFISKYGELVEGLDAFALMSFSKINVEQMTSFRLALAKQNIKVRVIKNTLAKRIFDETDYSTLSEHLTGPTLMAYSEGEADVVVTAKAIWDWVEKEDFNVGIKGGVALSQVMTGVDFEKLSKLPGREELFVGFLWALKSHPTKFLYALQDKPRTLGYALEALRAKKEQEAN